MLIRFMRWLLAIIHTEAEVHTHWGMVNARAIQQKHSCVNIVENERVFQVPSSSSEREIPE